MTYVRPIYIVKPNSDGSRKLGWFIQRFRGERRMSRQEVANRVDVSAEYIRLIENGTRSPSMDLVRDLLKCLGHPGEWRFITSVMGTSPQLVLTNPGNLEESAFEFTSRIKARRKTQKLQEDPLTFTCKLDFLNQDGASYIGPHDVTARIPRKIFDENGRPGQIYVVIREEA